VSHSRSTGRFLRAGLPLVAFSLLLGACSSGSPSETAAPGDDPSAPAAGVEAVGSCVLDGTPSTDGDVEIVSGPPITVAIVPKLLGLSVFEANVKGAEEVAQELGITVKYTASVEANGADQAQVIEGLINSNDPPDVIAYSANDPTTIVPALEAAKAKGIVVIGFDSDVTDTARSYFIQNTSYPAMGEAFVEAVVEKYGDTGSIGIVSTTTDAPIQNEWINAITTYMTDTYPNLTIADIVYGQSNAAASQTETVNLINSHPDMVAVFPLDSSAVPGALAAIKAQGMGGEIGVWGVSTPNANAQYFADDSLDGLFLWDEVAEGRLIAYLARGTCDGVMPAVGGTFTAGDLGTFTVEDKPAANTIIFSDPLLINKGNYEQYDF